MTRRLVFVFVATLALLGLASPALAKEGAVTKFDSLPTDWHAAQTYALGYTIKMDGVEPYKADSTQIIANSLDGKTNLSFAGVGDATPGHYTAQVNFPVAGTYHWKVTQGSFFAAFDLGSISVLPAIGATSAASSGAAAVGDPVRDAIPYLAAGVVLFGAFVLARQRRRILHTA